MNGVSEAKELHNSKMAKIDPSAPKRRKLIQKAVVTVRIEDSVGKQKGEGPPSDSWSWRKYGQKPIKGTPFPRGYYKCSTCKGCPAKKQVERCKVDASMLIVTYTSNHNHPGRDLPFINPTTPEECSHNPSSPKQSTATGEEAISIGELSPPKCSEDIAQQNPVTEEAVEDGRDHLSIISVPSPAPKVAEENDFFDELEELPIVSSTFSSLFRGSFFDERILLLPS
ncbi:uncharacterized protein [Typha latifolia]|uniref:uncharacterized protein n=1 Tax=Typha latifolia TaxID=4733 RepID=UPI003C30398F